MAAASWAIDYFHVYLYGKKFILFTDHKPLETLSKVHEKTLKRLQQQMMEYSFEIRYKKGLNNAAADALSWNAVEQVIIAATKVVREMGFKWEDLVKLQKEDEECKVMRAFIEDKKTPEEDKWGKILKIYGCGLYIENDMLMFMLRQPGRITARSGIKRWK